MTKIKVEPIGNKQLPALSVKKGFVYVLERAELNETSEVLCKVGYTSISALSRSKDYTDGGWKVHFETKMPDWLAKLVESDVHGALKEYWLDPKIVEGSAREVFICAPEHAVSELLRIKKLRTQFEIKELGGYVAKAELDDLRRQLKEQQKEMNALQKEVNALQKELSKDEPKRKRIKELEAIATALGWSKN
jgi:hypothetical protein